MFHIYGEQKPLGGLSPNFFDGRRPRQSRHSNLVTIGSRVLGWLRVKVCLCP